MNRVLGLFLTLVAAVFLQTAAVHAQDSAGPAVQRIVVEGNQRIEEATVISYMVI